MRERGRGRERGRRRRDRRRRRGRAAFARLGATDEIESIIKSVESVESREARDEDAVLREYEKIYHAFIAGRLAVDDPRDAEAVLRRWNLEKYDMERVADRKGRISRPVAASYGMIIDHYVRGGAMGEDAGAFRSVYDARGDALARAIREASVHDERLASFQAYDRGLVPLGVTTRVADRAAGARR